MNEIRTIAAIISMTEPDQIDVCDIFADKYERKCEMYDRLSDDYGQLKKDYYILEQKYWDSQRLIDEYDRGLEKERHFHNFWQKRYYEAVEDQTKLKNKNEDTEAIIAENIRLHNELTLAKMRGNEQQRYLEAYQKLYVDEVIKNNQLVKGKGYTVEMSNSSLLDILTEKIKENVIKEENGDA